MQLVNARTVSKQYAIPLSTVYHYVEKGVLPCILIGGRKKFDPIKIEKMLRQGETQVARTW